MKACVMAVLIGTFAASPALAGEQTVYRTILAGDLRSAESTLVAERRATPGAQELMLNLAAVYGQTGRASEARALYAKVLARPEVAMDMPSGSVISSHEVARLGLAKLDGRVLASR